MTLKPEHIRVNDIELANDIIWRMNETATEQDETIRKLTEELGKRGQQIHKKDMALVAVQAWMTVRNADLVNPDLMATVCKALEEQ